MHLLTVSLLTVDIMLIFLLLCWLPPDLTERTDPVLETEPRRGVVRRAPAWDSAECEWPSPGIPPPPPPPGGKGPAPPRP